MGCLVVHRNGCGWGVFYERLVFFNGYIYRIRAFSVTDVIETVGDHCLVVGNDTEGGWVGLYP